MVSLARKNLLENLPRFLAGQTGIMFAISLVTIQTGIFNGFTCSTTQLINNSEADIWVASQSLVNLELTLPIPVADLIQAQQVAGVERAEALIVKGALWYNSSGEIAQTSVIGFDPNEQLFVPRNIAQGSLSALRGPYTVIVDTTNLNSLHVRRIGDTAEIGSLPTRVVGLTQGNRSIASNPFIFTSLESANAYSTSGRTSTLSCRSQLGSTAFHCNQTYLNAPQTSAPTQLSPPVPKKLASSDLITYVLIRAQPGQDLQALKRKLEVALPNTRAYTRAELVQKTETFWQQQTGIGFILGLSAAVGVIVGVIIVCQILYCSVSEHLKEFGTFKAIGASDWVIYQVIVEQSLWMAILGYLPSMVLCSGVGAWTSATQGILILITPATAIAVLGSTIVLCVGSAIFAIQKVICLEPTVVFKA